MKIAITISICSIILFAISCKPKETPPPKVEIVEEEVKEVEPQPEPPKPKPIDEGVNLKDKYFIVIDSYTVEDFAKERAEFYNEKGFKTGIFMRNEDGWYRLALKSFNDYNQALKALEKLKEEKDYSKAWLMVK